jgi:ubiquinone/menaquinone biosynthesis C-methylase UbiE
MDPQPVVRKRQQVRVKTDPLLPSASCSVQVVKDLRPLRLPIVRRAVRLGERANGVAEVGLAGAAMLRLSVAQAALAADVVGELRRALDCLDDPPVPDTPRATTHEVAEGYRYWAETYDQPGNLLIDREQPVVEAMLRTFTGQPVLDAACGTGRHLAFLHGLGLGCIGVDSTPAMLDRARVRVPAADLREGDMASLPVGAGEVGELVCTLALEHVEELGPVYAEFARVLRPGGHAVISTLHPFMSDLFGWTAWLVDTSGQRREVRTNLHAVSDHLNAATGAGFVVERCVEERMDAESAESAAPAELKTAARVAYTGVPLVLALQLRRI